MKFKGGRKPIKRSSFSKKRPEKIGKITKNKGQRPSKFGGKGPQKAVRKGKDGKNNRRSTSVPMTPQVTHKEQNQVSKNQRKQAERIHKIFIEEELKKPQPDLQKLRSHLSQIKSRGLRQRLRSKMSRLSETN